MGERLIHCVLLGALLLAPGFTLADDGDSLAQARKLLDLQRYDESLSLLERALGADSDDAAALALRGELFRKTDRFAEARADYERLTRLRPGDRDAWFWLGTLERWRGRHGESVRAYTRALAIVGNDVGALKGRARARVAWGDDTQAIVDLERALDLSPGDAEAADLLAAALLRRRDVGAARRTLDAHFEGAERQRRLGDLALARGKPHLAVTHFNSALDQGPDDGTTLRGLAHAERMRGNTLPALAAYRRAAELDPSDGESLYWIGVLSTYTGRLDEGLKAYDRILAETPDHSSARIGRARILRARGRSAEALEILDQVLREEPENPEARVLRASIIGAAGRKEAARREYRELLSEDPDHGDARTGMGAVGSGRYLGLSGRSARSEVIEGLEDAGLEVAGETIVPTRIRYVNERAGAEYGWTLREGTDLEVAVGWGREAVTNRDADSDVYDFDVFRGSAGLEHRLSDNWRFSWSAGAVSYDSSAAGSIPDDERFEGGAKLVRRNLNSRIALDYSRSSFIQRGFAGGVQFGIFDRDRLLLDYRRVLRGGHELSASAGVSDFDDGSTVGSGAVGVDWSRGLRHFAARLRHEPFPARFLTAAQQLDFIPYTEASFSVRGPIGRGFSFADDVLYGRIGRTPRTLIQDLDMNGIPELVEGPLDHNNRLRVRSEISWAPARLRPLALGIEYLDESWDFDTGTYNNNDTDGWFAFAQLADRRSERMSYAVRYTHGILRDERDSSYDTDRILARLEFRLRRGDRPTEALRLGLDARYHDNDLDEDLQDFGLYLRVPF